MISELQTASENHSSVSIMTNFLSELSTHIEFIDEIYFTLVCCILNKVHDIFKK